MTFYIHKPTKESIILLNSMKASKIKEIDIKSLLVHGYDDVSNINKLDLYKMINSDNLNIINKYCIKEQQKLNAIRFYIRGLKLNIAIGKSLYKLLLLKDVKKIIKSVPENIFNVEEKFDKKIYINSEDDEIFFVETK